MLTSLEQRLFPEQNVQPKYTTRCCGYMNMLIHLPWFDFPITVPVDESCVAAKSSDEPRMQNFKATLKQILNNQEKRMIMFAARNSERSDDEGEGCEGIPSEPMRCLVDLELLDAKMSDEKSRRALVSTMRMFGNCSLGSLAFSLTYTLPAKKYVGIFLQPNDYH